MKLGDSWNLLPFGWPHNIRVSNVGLKAKGVPSDLVVGLGASIWLAYSIKKNWRKKVKRWGIIYLGLRKNLEKNSAYLRYWNTNDSLKFRMNYLYLKIDYKQISKFSIYLYSITVISFYNYEWLRILSHIKIFVYQHIDIQDIKSLWEILYISPLFYPYYARGPWK